MDWFLLSAELGCKIQFYNPICSLQDIPVIHAFNARFKEKIGDLSGARSAYHQFNAESSSYVENVIKEANMEKRLV